MAVPDHFMNNNHEGFGMEFIRLLLLIEGEKGYDPAVFRLAAAKARAMLDWYLDGDGMCYESIKGWLNDSAFVAVGRRQRDLLKHSHLRAKMRFFQAALHWENGHWEIRDEMRASAFHPIWMMHHFFPHEARYDLLYSATLTSHPFLTDPNARWPDPVGITMELLLLFADGAAPGPDGKPLDWTDQARLDALKLPITWKDDLRGYVYTRNSWRKDDLLLGFTCKQDFYYGGHEGSENNRFILWGGGVNWVRDTNMLAVKATFLQNMLTVDGHGLTWPPVPGVWLGVRETADALTAAGDGRNGYTYGKVMQVHPLDFPSAKLPYYAPFTEGNFDLTRDLQIAFHPGTVKWNDGYAHTDYGPWSGETRLVENYRISNPMEQAYRTVHLARGEHPYVLVLDDARKDGLKHMFDWNITLPEDVELLDAQTPEVAFQNVEPTAGRDGDLLLTRPNTPRDPASGKLLVQKGDPLFLVRILWRRSDYGFPVPRLERFNGSPERPFQRFSHLTIPAFAESPEFRILLYPHRQGDPLPVTTWNRDRTELTVEFKGQRDLYRFAAADGGRTVFAMERNQKTVLESGAPPARPVLDVRGRRFDANDLRTTRFEGKIPEYRFVRSMTASLVRPPPPACIRYTLDGSDPTPDSPRYEAPLTLERTTELRARLFDPAWPGAVKASAVLTARFTACPAAPGLEAPPAGSEPGVLASVYEKKTVLWNDRGFFDAARAMLPDLTRETPLLTARTRDFQIPHTVPAQPIETQAKGFYRFTGWFHAPAAGVYEFGVDSCGPVLFEMGRQTVIEATGVFHQQQAVRRGEAALGAGWHAFELTVCDPLFWNIATTDRMPFAVTVRREGGEAAPVAEEALRFQPAGQVLTPEPQTAWQAAATPPAWMEPGAVLSYFERDGKNRDADYLDLDRLTPVRSERVSRFEPNFRPAWVRCYDAWFQAPVDGVYTFELPARREENARLGELRAAYQNQLRVGGEVVVQHGIAGRVPLRRIGLKAGWHPLSLRLGASLAEGSVTYPDGQTLALTAALLFRPVSADIRPQGAAEARSLYEIYGPTPVTLTLPEGRTGEIRYTLDGHAPGAASAVCIGPLTVDATTELTASVFVAGKEVTAPARVKFVRVNIPEYDRISGARLGAWDGTPGATRLDTAAAIWILPGSRLAEGRDGKALAVNRGTAADENVPKAVDVNLTRGMAESGFKVTGLRMKENAISVGFWFLSDTADGKLFGKDGYNAFGKRYTTVSCALENGRLRAGPGRVQGGKVQPGTWNHVVLTADAAAIRLYLNGEPVAEGPGSSTLTTDSLDFFAGHPALVDRLGIYNRVLAPDDIAHWFRHERDQASKK